MIIDVHAHLGIDYVFDESQNEEKLVGMYDRCKVDKAIIQPYICRPYIEDTKKAHDRIYNLCQAYPNRYFGMISINPHFTPVDFETEARRCVKELNFIGIKIATAAHAVSPSSADGMHVFEVARELGIPVMIHTGIGAPFADPAAAWKAIEVFPDVKVVLAHAGVNTMQVQAIMLAKKYNNVFLEPSWVPGVCIRDMVKTLGPEKIMFSSDSADNLPIALDTFRHSIQNPEHLCIVMSETAKQVYKFNGDL